MTAEVAIVNKMAIAVAADSAVTVGRTKVHRSATKIFSISNRAPIGAMVYGYSELGGMPWEVLLKLYRSACGDENFSTVADCYARFLEFLSDAKFRNDDRSDENLIRFGIEVVEYVKDLIEAQPRSRRNAADVLAAIERERRSYEEIEGRIEFDHPSLNRFRRHMSEMIGPIVDGVFEGIGVKVARSTLPRFTDLIYTALTSPYMLDFKSGVVIFGFGASELFPGLINYEFDGTPFRTLRYKFEDNIEIHRDGATILPFADRDVMDTLIAGRSFHERELFLESLSIFAEEIANKIIEDNLQPDEQLVGKALSNGIIKRKIRDFQEITDEYLKSKYVYKMIDVIDNMPKEDIAILAEALVEITALRIRASEPVESVAGPIDVCVITKGDGLIWIKRKHYFDLTKNLQYLYRRYGVMPGLVMGGDSGEE